MVLGQHEKACDDILYPTGCKLEDCKTKCYAKHGGAPWVAYNCYSNAADFMCICFYKCD